MSADKVRRTRIMAFVIFAACFASGFILWKMLQKEPDKGGVPTTLTGGLKVNEKIFSGLFSQSRQAKTFPLREAAARVRVNGGIGLGSALDSANWKLQVLRKNGDTLLITLDDLKKLPKTEIVFDFKCIEGWSQKTWWGGVKFTDFVKYYNLQQETNMSYVGLITPDRGYYVGIDMPSMTHAQTILCYEMNGKPLPLNQGYPLRLIIPLKYGIKHLKRIGTMSFSDSKPPDYWAEQGYDYYSGH